MLNAGDLLEGRYKVQRVLGEGGMGAVYLVSDTRLPRQWAVKEMADHLTEPAERQAAEAAFKAESEILAGLTHPNLPRVVDCFNHQGRHYLVMDYIEGTALDKRLENGPLSVAEVIDMALQISEVLEYLHSQTRPVIFRDLKPGNIIILEGGTVKLIDFGIARIFSDGKSSDTRALGTPGYAAPEQYGKGQSDERTDIFGLGATLYHALTGRDPSEKPFQFPPLRQDRPEVPEALEAALLKAVSLKPQDRFARASEFREAIEALRQDREAYQHLPARLKTAPLAAPLTEGFDPPLVRFGKLGQRQQSRLEVIIRGEVNLKLRSDSRWLKVKPNRVKGSDQVIGLYVDTTGLRDGGSLTALVNPTGTPELTPLRVELEVTPYKIPAWAPLLAALLALLSFAPVLGYLTTCTLLAMVVSAPRGQRRALKFFTWVAVIASLFWTSFAGLMYGLHYLDTKSPPPPAPVSTPAGPTSGGDLVRKVSS